MIDSEGTIELCALSVKLLLLIDPVPEKESGVADSEGIHCDVVGVKAREVVSPFTTACALIEKALGGVPIERPSDPDVWEGVHDKLAALNVVDAPIPTGVASVADVANTGELLPLAVTVPVTGKSTLAIVTRPVADSERLSDVA